jgi:hypothetical protein
LTFIDFRLICLPKDLTKAYCSVQGGVNQPGLMPLALERIVEMAEVRGSKVEVSFFEVYMDRCYDLLEPKEADITVLDDGHGRIQLRGLAQVICTLLICLLALCCNQHHSAYGSIHSIRHEGHTVSALVMILVFVQRRMPNKMYHQVA